MYLIFYIIKKYSLTLFFILNVTGYLKTAFLDSEMEQAVKNRKKKNLYHIKHSYSSQKASGIKNVKMVK